MNNAPHLRVIDGGKKARDENRRKLAKAAVLAAGIMGVGAGAGILNERLHRGEQAHMMAGRGGVVLTYSKPQEELSSLSQRFERLSNRELLAKLLREGEDAGFQKGLEHNMASLILETRKERAVPDMADALANDPSPMARTAIAYCLGRMGLDSALPALQSAARSDDGRVRIASEEAIREIREKNKDKGK